MVTHALMCKKTDGIAKLVPDRLLRAPAENEIRLFFRAPAENEKRPVLFLYFSFVFLSFCSSRI